MQAARVGIARGDAVVGCRTQRNNFDFAMVRHVGHIGARSPGTGADTSQQRIAYRVQRRTVETVGWYRAVVAIRAVHIG